MRLLSSHITPELVLIAKACLDFMTWSRSRMTSCAPPSSTPWATRWWHRCGHGVGACVRHMFAVVDWQRCSSRLWLLAEAAAAYV